MRSFLFALGLLFACGCSNGGNLECVQNLNTMCSPLYQPTFDNLYTRTLHPTCAQVGNTCHSSQGAKNGLVFEDETTAYELLLGTKDGRQRVIPNNPSCSLLIEHLESTDPSQVMPPGGMLQEPERCGFILWIAQGAKR